MADVDVDVVRLQCGTNATIEIIGISPCSTPSERIVGWIFITQFCVWLYQKKKVKRCNTLRLCRAGVLDLQQMPPQPFSIAPPPPPISQQQIQMRMRVRVVYGSRP